VPGGAQREHQDILAREVFGVNTYSQLSTDTRQSLSQLADDAAFDIVNIGKWFMLTDPDFTNQITSDLQAEFNELWRLMWTERAYRTFRSPQLAAQYHRDTVEPLYRRVVDNLDTEFLIPASSNWADAISLETMMRSIIGILVSQRTPVIPGVSEAMRTIREEYVKLWEERRWSFKVRHTTLQIATTGAVNFGDDGTTDFGFDGFASKYIWIISNSRPYKCQWLDSTRFAQAKAEYDQLATSTGRPRYFYTEDWGSDPLIHWAPDPDQAYTGYANILLRAPAFSGDHSDNGTGNGLNSLPPPFRGHLRDRVVARLLSKWGREDTDAKRLFVQVRSDAIELTDNWSERGAEASAVAPPAGNKMVRQLRSYRGSPVIGQWE
jgi:hypothetical protein